MERAAQIRFDGWTLLRPTGELMRDGRRIRLQEHPLEVLEALLEEPGALVTREALIARLWPNQVVDFDTALNTAVRRLRSALGDDADAPRYIETLPRRGYRFIAALEPAIPAPASAPAPADEAAGPALAPGSRRRTATLGVAALLLAAAAAGLIWTLDREAPSPNPAGRADRTPAGRSIVVLPLVDLDGDGGSQLLADGLTEDLITRLARSERLDVIARTSAFAYRGRDADVATVARELGVTHVLQGSVRRSGATLRVATRLIDAGTGAHVWAQSYDRKLGDAFEIQADIASQVAAALEVRLADVPGGAKRPHPAAYEHYLVGRHLFGRRGPGDVSRALDRFEQALEIDPDYARAWSGVASANWILMTIGELDRDRALEELRKAAERAIELDPALAEPHVRLAKRASALGDDAAYRLHWQQAIELEPNDPLVMNAAIEDAQKAGNARRAVELTYRQIELDPLSTLLRYNAAWKFYELGRYEEAAAQVERAAEFDPGVRRDVECYSRVMLAQHAAARSAADRMPEGPERLACEALSRHGLGDRAGSDAALAALYATAATTHPYLIASVHARRGEKEAAFAWLGRAPEICRPASRYATACYGRLQSRSPLLAPLQSDPRWPGLYARISAPR